MTDTPFVLTDRVRAEQFLLLGRTRRLFQPLTFHVDRDGIAWATKQVGGHVFAVTWLGPGWVFDPFASRVWADKLTACLLAVRRAKSETHQQELRRVLARLRLGAHSERLLWLIHQQVMQARSSLLQLADISLAAAVWGQDRTSWPRQWRQDLIVILQGLAWLHVAPALASAAPSFGPQTALLTHVADLRGNDADACAGFCPEQAPARHHHYLINVGRGFLGLLEQFGNEAPATGSRQYHFPARGPRDAGPTLQRVGQTGRLLSIYLPARLGEPAACARLTAPQHRLLQALVRETTRAPRRRRQGATEEHRFVGNTIPSAVGKRKVPCPLLSPHLEYVGFNGNGKRAGLGYYLTTSGGWLAKAGYGPDKMPAFLADLAALQDALGLTVVGIEKSSRRCYNLTQLQALAGAAALHGTFQRVLVRIYTRADYVERWNRFFLASGALTPQHQKHDDVLAFVTEMDRRGISRRDLAQGLGADPSFLSKLFNGKKPWPADLLARCKAWLAGTPSEASRPSLAPWPSLPTWTEGSDSLLEVALAYLERGWSVVPQRPGEKKPTIRWKPYQTVLPSIHELRRWFRHWPSAGLAVILGAVSALFVIDVDGSEAHAALLRHLGEEPLAPKALSGSRKPDRYHLFFRCPPCPTKAKTTPWHPQLEFRGQGGIVVIPPSLHKSGHRYEWAPGRSPADLALPEVPQAILAALQTKGRSSNQEPVAAADGLRASPSTRRFLAGKYADGPKWNDRLYRAACDLAARGVAPEQAEPLLLAGARPWNESERETALRTIRSAYSQTREPGMA